ncbi:hypothetical protein LBMAG42_43680 [Deltaproteobacteria bacterium]|nr:hypothetical protein LBMAG42_43680 [Deltaproteobacteria bacterium]
MSDDVDEPLDLVVTVRLDDGSLLTSGHPDKLGQLSLSAVLPEGSQRLTIEVEDTEHHLAGTHVDVYSSPFTFDPPVVLIVPPDAVTGDALVARIVTDAVPGDGHLVDYAYVWKLDGVATEWEGAELPAGVPFAGDAWSVSVVGRSETAESAAGTAELTIGNAPPILADAVVEPSADASTVTCAHAEVEDPEGARLSTRYRWDLDGTLISETTVSIDAPTGKRGAAVGCTVSVSDGTTAVSATALPWALPNHAPSVPTVAVSPEVATTESPLSCTLPDGVSDVDGDEVFVTFAWFVNGARVQGDASTFSGGIARGDEVGCEATAADGLGGITVVASADVTIDNTPPTTPEVAISPEAPTAGDTLTCGIVTPARDADGDPLRCDFRWEVGLPAGAGERFDTSGLSGGTAVSCVLTCFDGLESGRGGTDSVTLAAPISGDGSAGDAMVQIVGTVPNGRFGALVVALPDLDGDGRTDLGIGAPGATAGGAVYVFPAAALQGAEQLSADDASGSWIGDNSGDNVGSFGSVTSAGDLDGDGAGDVTVAAPWSDVGGHDAGQVYAIYGGFALTTDAPLSTLGAWSVSGEPGDWFGSRVAGGDLDGDGIADLVASGPASDLGGAHSGVVAVFTGETTRRTGTLDLSDADAIVVGGPGDQLGWGLATCPDADGDGIAELAMGASRASTGGAPDAGLVGLASGAGLGSFDTFEAVTWLRIAGDAAGDRVGAAVACPGDLDDDGLGELVFGAPRHDTTRADAGLVAIFFGRAEADGGLLTSDADALVYGEAADDQLGSVVVPGGDLDHDGVSDLLLGAPGSSSSAGLVDVLLSASAGDWSPAGVTPDARIAGNAMTDRVGEALAGGLDLEGDGFGEVALGAAHADAAIVEGGAVYVFSGRSAMR